MAMNDMYADTEPTRAEVDSLKGPTVLEFGAPWCPHCIGAQPLLGSAFSGYPQVRHIKVEDGKGRPLGRSFRVKLWPTLIFLQDGQEVDRVVRPTEGREIEQAFAKVAASA